LTFQTLPFSPSELLRDTFLPSLQCLALGCSGRSIKVKDFWRRVRGVPSRTPTQLSPFPAIFVQVPLRGRFKSPSAGRCKSGPPPLRPTPSAFANSASSLLVLNKHPLRPTVLQSQYHNSFLFLYPFWSARCLAEDHKTSPESFSERRDCARSPLPFPPHTRRGIFDSRLFFVPSSPPAPACCVF